LPTSCGGSNLVFVEVLYKGWPYVFVATVKSVAAGDELLLDYGDQYWSSRARRSKGHYVVLALALGAFIALPIALLSAGAYMYFWWLGEWI
jgi:hypothetical protein